jgi:hypothetical protein
MGDRNRLVARLPGLVARLEKDLSLAEQRVISCRRRLTIAKVQGPAQVERLNADLAAIDATIGQHDIEIDPNLLSQINGQRNGRLFDQGRMTRLILKALKEAEDAEISTTELALIVAEEAGLMLSDREFLGLKTALRRRLRRLVILGAVRRIHVARTSLEGRWAAARPQSQAEVSPAHL